jgi:8-hydroxy-5-deazaflavin:NADPH oxidoreductase
MSQARQNIAVVGGTGAEGCALALRFAQAGHAVTIGSRDRAKAERTAIDLNKILGGGTIAYAGNIEAAAAAEIVVLAVPYAAQKSTVEGIRAVLAGKILIDTTAPLMPPRVNRVQLPGGGSAVAATQALLGAEVRVVSAFQNVSAQKLRDLGRDVACDVLVCADDMAARETVIGLAAAIGLRGIDAGPICNSAAAEALTSVLIWINRKYRVPGAGIRITDVEH